MNSKTDIFVKNLDLSDDLHDYVEKKTDKLDKFLNKIDEKRIDLAFNKNATRTTKPICRSNYPPRTWLYFTGRRTGR